MIDDLTEGIVRILNSAGDTAGTGFVLTEDGLIATCAHVVESAGAGPGDTIRLVFHHSGDEATATVEPEGWRDPRPASRRNGRTPHPERATPLHSGRTLWLLGRKIRKIGYERSLSYVSKTVNRDPH